MNAHTVDTFFQSTCVIVVFAYLLTRSPLIALLSQERVRGMQILTLGGVFGLAGLLELFFASDRFPYDTYTLIITFAALRSGLRVGLVTAVIVATGAALFQAEATLERTVFSVLVSVGAGTLVRRVEHTITADEERPFKALILGSVSAIVLAETGAIMLRLLEPGGAPVPFSLSIALLKIVANGLGVVLLQMILNDAQGRLVAERFRAEAERSRTLLAEAKLTALRARIHPHFLFNALTSIAALCRLAPDKAETATVQLGQIMRRALEVDPRAAVPLEDEIAYVEDYIEIEKLRLGSRLRIVWDVDPACASLVRIPTFSLQTLVENAILHGVAPKLEPGTVTVTVRGYQRHVLVSVSDDGVGIEGSERARALASPKPASSGVKLEGDSHGLQITTQQLCLLYGNAARLRLFSHPDQGTHAVFILPTRVAGRRLRSERQKIILTDRDTPARSLSAAVPIRAKGQKR
jgi:LytS/YehU family sensor histidine kinase